MRYARALIPILEQPPSDATRVSHVLHLRAGYVSRRGGGIYAYLPFGRDYHLGPANEEGRVTIGKTSLESSRVELKLRGAKDPKPSEIVGLDRAATQVFELVQQALRVPAAGEAA